MKNSTTTSIERSAEQVSSPRTRLVARILSGLICTYQRFTSGRPSPCRFYPSCSQYGLEAIEQHGALRGSLLGLRRLSKCRPFGPHGVDLVPELKKPRSS